MNSVREKEGIIDAFQDQIGSISNTVGTLEKLSQTDEELLKKYSKVYFLNENYSPARLTDIDKKYLYNGTTNFMIHTDVWPHLQRLLEEAQEDKIDLLVASAFRSFQSQSALKSSYLTTYGSGANKFSADQGYSEHQLGTALDFTTSKIGGSFDKFSADPAYKWLQNNAHRYGFILSYPANNTYYKFEPWHWRYVGVKLATHLHDDGKFFYDLDQREIDKYLVNLFE
jgi:LAS superfamily LD-carboxypeptidase LdcB